MGEIAYVLLAAFFFALGADYVRKFGGDFFRIWLTKDIINLSSNLWVILGIICLVNGIVLALFF